MNKLLLSFVFVGAIAASAAEAPKAVNSPEPAKSIQFYAGVSLGWDNLGVKRNEDLQNPGATVIFSNKKQSANGVTGKFVLGFLWTIPETAFVLSPEIYLGWGSAKRTLNATGVDSFDNSTKSLRSNFKQKTTMGLILRAGYYLTNRQNDLLFVLFGVDQTRFENSIDVSSTPVGLANVPTLTTKRSKKLVSPVFGLGFEHKFERIKVGIDLRYQPYKSWRYSTGAMAVSEDNVTLKFRPRIISTSLTVCYLF